MTFEEVERWVATRDGRLATSEEAAAVCQQSGLCVQVKDDENQTVVGEVQAKNKTDNGTNATTVATSVTEERVLAGDESKNGSKNATNATTNASNGTNGTNASNGTNDTGGGETNQQQKRKRADEKPKTRNRIWGCERQSCWIPVYSLQTNDATTGVAPYDTLAPNSTSTTTTTTPSSTANASNSSNDSANASTNSTTTTTTTTTYDRKDYFAIGGRNRQEIGKLFSSGVPDPANPETNLSWPKWGSNPRAGRVSKKTGVVVHTPILWTSQGETADVDYTFTISMEQEPEAQSIFGGYAHGSRVLLWASWGDVFRDE